MTGKEKMLEQLKNVAVRRYAARGVVATPEMEDSIRDELLCEWDSYGYDAARIRAERAELISV